MANATVSCSRRERFLARRIVRVDAIAGHRADGEPIEFGIDRVVSKAPTVPLVRGNQKGDGGHKRKLTPVPFSFVKVHGPPKLIEAGKEFPFIVVSPQCPAGRWWDADELSALLDYMEANYKVDKQRIYVTGPSMGGFGTWSLAFQESPRLAAVAPICGGGNAIAARYTKSITTPAWAFHGAKDPVVPLSKSQEMIDALKQNNIEAKLTVYEDAGHDSWTEAYNNEELYTWLLAHKRDN